MTLEEAQLLIGKRVTIKDENGKDFIGGVLQWVGINDYLWGLQVTVDRMPMAIKSLDQIVEQEDRRIFKAKSM